LSFKQAAFFIHLWIQSGRLSAGNIRVPLTRPSSLDDLRLLAPLYNNPKEKEAIVVKFINAFKSDPAYVAEMARLKVLQGYPKVDEKSSLLERQALSEKVGEGIAQSED
jgi:hypothetical protein